MSSCSCAEANLLIICACFPTVRTFIRSVAPGLLSSNNRSPSDSKRRGLSETFRLRSRSRPRRNAYEGFDLDQLQTFVTSENHDGNGSEESAWHEDGIPRDAILQTKTMDITTGREVPWFMFYMLRKQSTITVIWSKMSFDRTYNSIYLVL